MHFRDDINGLRAIAVAMVVLYHFRVGVAPGGFAGVDVFFVISGFLMTQIVLGRLERGRFSLLDFYLARMRRIVPAMTVLVAATFAIGVALMNPLQLEGLAHSALASLLFFSNIRYAHETGYFAAPPEDNWLIHTWSLSVEWQFYMLYPLALMALARLGARILPRKAGEGDRARHGGGGSRLSDLDRFDAAPPGMPEERASGSPLHHPSNGPPPLLRGGGCARQGLRWTTACTMALIAVSLALTITNWQVGGGRLQQGFFLLPSRAWEFLAGGLVTMLGPRIALPARARIALHAAGLVLVALGVALVDRTSAWPSPMTILPVAGTALVLLAARERAWWARLAPVAALGRWSYSIYLWHWPIVAILAFSGRDSKAFAIAGIALSVACGFASYALVETRFTTWLWQSRHLGRPFAASLFAGVAALTLFATATNGLESIKYAGRPDILAQLADDRAAQADWTFPKSCDRFRWDPATNVSRCEFGDPAVHDTLVIGDSFAEQLTPRFTHALVGRGVTFVTLGGCPPIPGIERSTPGMNCRRFTDIAYADAASTPARRVVVTAMWPGYGADNLCVGPDGACTRLDESAFDARLRAAFSRMAARWRALREAGKEVIVVDVPPYGAGDPAALYAKAIAGKPVANLSRPLADLEAETHEASTMLAEAARAAGVTYVDPAPALCPQGECPIVVGGRTLYKDDAHLRASILKDPRFAIYDRIIAPGPASEISRR